MSSRAITAPADPVEAAAFWREQYFALKSYHERRKKEDVQARKRLRADCAVAANTRAFHAKQLELTL